MGEDNQSEETTNIQPSNVKASALRREFIDKVCIELIPLNDKTSPVSARFVRCPSVATIFQLQKLVKLMLNDQSIKVCLNIFF